MRVFIAIELPEEIRQRLSDLERELKPTTTSARWVAVESIHLTVKFIGETTEAGIAAIDESLSGLTWKPIQVSVKGVGFFPGTRSPRIFWAGLVAPGLDSLAGKIDLRMERLGFEKENRAFRPHLTLARARNVRLDAALVHAAERFGDLDCGSFIADRCFLIQSTLKPSGAVYTKLKEYIFNQK
jgi:2'-5' RNA ligase